MKFLIITFCLFVSNVSFCVSSESPIDKDLEEVLEIKAKKINGVFSLPRFSRELIPYKYLGKQLTMPGIPLTELNSKFYFNTEFKLTENHLNHLIPIDNIHFTQQYISPDGFEENYEKLADALDHILQSEYENNKSRVWRRYLKENLPPCIVFFYKGKGWSIGNRRLAQLTYLYQNTDGLEEDFKYVPATLVFSYVHLFDLAKIQMDRDVECGSINTNFNTTSKGKYVKFDQSATVKLKGNKIREIRKIENKD